MKTTTFSTITLLLLTLVPFVSLQSQELGTPVAARDGNPTQQSSPRTQATGLAGVYEPRMTVDQNPAPATTTTDDYVFPSAEHRQKRYFRRMVGPVALGRVAVSAGVDQWKDSPEEWEQGAEGYGKRLASQFGRNAIRQTVTFALSEALRLDNGFERSKRTGFLPRLGDALVQNVTSRKRSGKRVISAPIIAGAYVAPVIATETWYPSRYSYKDGLRIGTYSLAVGFGINVVREFVFNW